MGVEPNLCHGDREGRKRNRGGGWAQETQMGDQWGLGKEAAIFKVYAQPEGHGGGGRGGKGRGREQQEDSKPLQAVEQGQNEQGWGGWRQRKTVHYSDGTLDSWSFYQIFIVS